jgi:hypothetical protein
MKNPKNPYTAPPEPKLPDRLAECRLGDDRLMTGPPPVTQHNSFKGLDEDGVEISVKRLPPVPSRSFISVKPQFWERPIRDICVKLWSLASSMNHALDIMQQERNQVIKVCETQEKQIKQLTAEKAQLLELFKQQTAKANEQASSRAEEIVSLRTQQRG